MIRTISFRALTLATVLALGTPLTAFAAPGNTGGAAKASEFQIGRSIDTTQGSVNLAENTGNAAQASGNALAAQAPVSHLSDSRHDLRVGNAASAIGGFGTGAQG